MFYGDTIQETREFFYASWGKFQYKKLLSPLESQIVQVIQDHPEYHELFENKDKFQQQSYAPGLGEPNPFLHMGLHLAVREQITTDRPIGVRALYSHLMEKYKDPFQVEHLIMDQLAECLWLSQRNNLPPDEKYYLQILANL